MHLQIPSSGGVRRIRLTDRWTPLKPHEMQALYMWHPARFKINPSGRRSGKTEIAKRKGVLKLVRKRRHPARIFFAAPSYGQAKDIFWNDLKALIPPWWIAKIRESDLEITMKWGAMVRVFGFDRPRRIEGVIWDWGCIDELADTQANCFDLNVRPAMATVGREGSCDLIGTPDEVGRNQIEYEKLWEIGLKWSPELASMTREQLTEMKADPNICSFWWPSSDILSADEIAGMKLTMSAHHAAQELGGKFVRSGGRAFPDYDPKYHISARHAEYVPGLPLWWSLDFGRKYACSLIGQRLGDRLWVLDEIVLTNSSTDNQVRAFRDLIQERGWHGNKIELYGDAAGHTHHSNTGRTDYEIIEAMTGDLRIEMNEFRAAPLIKDTVNAVRGRLCNFDGHVNLHLHPRCVQLAKDLKEAPWPDKLEDFHTLAALRYYCMAIWGEETAGYDVSDLYLPKVTG